MRCRTPHHSIGLTYAEILRSRRIASPADTSRPGAVDVLVEVRKPNVAAVAVCRPESSKRAQAVLDARMAASVRRAHRPGRRAACRRRGGCRQADPDRHVVFSAVSSTPTRQMGSDEAALARARSRSPSASGRPAAVVETCAALADDRIARGQVRCARGRRPLAELVDISKAARAVGRRVGQAMLSHQAALKEDVNDAADESVGEDDAASVRRKRPAAAVKRGRGAAARPGSGPPRGRAGACSEIKSLCGKRIEAALRAATLAESGGAPPRLVSGFAAAVTLYVSPDGSPTCRPSSSARAAARGRAGAAAPGAKLRPLAPGAHCRYHAHDLRLNWLRAGSRGRGRAAAGQAQGGRAASAAYRAFRTVVAGSRGRRALQGARRRW